MPGASGEANSYRNLADELSARYQVVTYDRRGFSRSQLLGAQDYDQRLATDAGDVRRLIKHLGGEPAIVVGNSSGALVALEVLIRHPDVVHTVVAHEPPAVPLLPDGEAWVAFFEAVYDTYRRSGIHPALAQFGDGIAAGPERAAMARARDPNNSPQAAANVLYWFERELRQYTRTGVDLAALAVHATGLSWPGDVTPRSRSPTSPTPCWPRPSARPSWTCPVGMSGSSPNPPNSPAHCSTCSTWSGRGAGRPGKRTLASPCCDEGNVGVCCDEFSGPAGVPLRVVGFRWRLPDVIPGGGAGNAACSSGGHCRYPSG